MKNIGIIIGCVCILISFVFNIIGLMGVIPLYITAPPLFLSLLVTIYLINYRNRFKGFKSTR
ncbi:hypothetical protein [Litchfieldia salsa]|uniref:hypothetical protein n=1 Tax=Litchfieldia salsa TaxID=930152 RepID=UPI000B8054FE